MSGGEPVFLPFRGPLLPATFLRRRMRFLADMRLDDGREITAHCANTGTMKGCLFPGHRALLADRASPTRKLRYSWLAIEGPAGWIGIDTGLPNRLARLAIAAGAVPALAGYERVLAERPMGEGSRVDLLLEGARGRCFVEVKNVTLVEGGVARFPDAVTERGRKHLRELAARVAEGDRAAMLYVVQRQDGRAFAPADDLDPAYGQELRRVVGLGVETYALSCVVTDAGVGANGMLPVDLP